MHFRVLAWVTELSSADMGLWSAVTNTLGEATAPGGLGTTACCFLPVKFWLIIENQPVNVEEGLECQKVPSGGGCEQESRVLLISEGGGTRGGKDYLAGSS